LNENENSIIRAWKNAPDERTRIDAVRTIVKDYGVLVCVFLREDGKCVEVNKLKRLIPP
jgi:hypothetical protein